MNTKHTELGLTLEQTAGNLIAPKYTPQEIGIKTKQMYEQIIKESKNFKEGNFTKFSANDLKYLFELYDFYFFDNFFNKNYNEKISFRLSKRMTKSGGQTVYRKHSDTYEISLSITLIFQNYSDTVGEIVVNGIVCQDRLEATMRILEHEIIHLFEWILFGSSSCSGKRFKQFCYNIFNHTDIKHQLITSVERAYKKFNLRVGDKVEFEFDGQTRSGIIYRINNRATVMVEASKGLYKDSKGRRYSKYYVPIDSLRKASQIF